MRAPQLPLGGRRPFQPWSDRSQAGRQPVKVLARSRSPPRGDARRPAAPRKSAAAGRAPRPAADPAGSRHAGLRNVRLRTCRRRDRRAPGPSSGRTNASLVASPLMAGPVQITADRRFRFPLQAGFDYITELRSWPEYWPNFIALAPQSRWSQPGDTARLTLRLAGRADGAPDDADADRALRARRVLQRPARPSPRQARAALRGRSETASPTASSSRSSPAAACCGRSTGSSCRAWSSAPRGRRSTTSSGGSPSSPPREPRPRLPAGHRPPRERRVGRARGAGAAGRPARAVRAAAGRGPARRAAARRPARATPAGRPPAAAATDGVRDRPPAARLGRSYSG